MSGWQGIETAPRTGKAVLLSDETNGVIIGHYANAWVSDALMHWDEDGPEYCKLAPTSWMPLPAPPDK